MRFPEFVLFKPGLRGRLFSCCSGVCRKASNRFLGLDAGGVDGTSSLTDFGILGDVTGVPGLFELMVEMTESNQKGWILEAVL